MINSKEIKKFMKKLEDLRDVYCKMIDEKEREELSFADKNTISIWENRINAISKAINELDMLEFELFV